MLLYWGLFTVGFLFGSILSFVTFAPKKPEEDAEYETQPDLLALKGQSAPIEAKFEVQKTLFGEKLEKSTKDKPAFAKKDSIKPEFFLTN